MKNCLFIILFFFQIIAYSQHEGKPVEMKPVLKEKIRGGINQSENYEVPILAYRTSSYTISYPENWKLDTSKMMGIDLFIVSPPDSSVDKFRENINVLSGQIGEDISLDSFYKTSEISIKTMATELEILESKKINSAGKEFYKIDFTATQGIFKLRFVQFYFASNGKGYTITATVERDKFNSYEKKIIAILESFSLNQ